MIRLEPFARTDFARLIGWVDSPRFMFQWGGHTFRFPLDEEQLEKYIQSAASTDSPLRIYKVVLADSAEVIGHIDLKVDPVNNSGRIGKVLVGKGLLRGQGIGRLMIEEILKIAFEEWKVHRVSLGVFDFNTGAMACYEKAGFVKEGLFREARRVGTEYWNLWEMSVLAAEWMERRR